jgi:hypothetical protein
MYNEVHYIIRLAMSFVEQAQAMVIGRLGEAQERR